MTVLRFDSAEDSSFDLTDPGNLRIAQVLTTDAINWRYTNENGTTVQFLGAGMTYDETGRPISGTIETVRVVLPSGDVFAIDQALDAASIAAQPETLWDTVMSGKDVINIIELGSQANGTSTVFGDGINAARSRDAKAITGMGENDVFILGSGSYRLLGDVETVSGIDVFLKVDGGRAKDIFARYEGGNDLITGAETDREQRIVGDAGAVGANGTLFGGDDTLSILSSDRGSYVSGDAEEAFGIKGAIATVIGGDDEIKGLKDSAAALVGDLVFANDFIVLKGGDDAIDGSAAGEFISGDLGVADADEKVSITGGSDLIDGGNGDDVIAGEAFFVHSDDGILKAGNGRPRKVTRLTVEGGDDVIDGGNGSDTIYGEVGPIGSTKSARAVQPRISGGNDTISGGADDDLIFGQTGNDKISGDAGNDELFGGSGKDRIMGGTGADRLSGGAGADLFVFRHVAESSSASADLLVDFRSRQGDRIDLRLIDADTTRDGIQAFDFIGKSVEGQTGQLRVERIDGATVLAADVDGLGGDDFRIVFEGKVRLIENDFLF